MSVPASPAEPALENLVTLAAEKRVAGEKWQAVADAVRRSLGTVQKWPKQYPDLWKQHYAKAEAALLKDASSEAMLTLRQLLRAESEPVRQAAAQKILQIREDRKKPARKKGDGAAGSPVPEIRQLVDYLEGLSHERYAELFDEGGAGTAPPGGPAETAFGDPPRPALPE